MALVMPDAVIFSVVGFSLNAGAGLLEARLLRWRER
jgi:ABC-type nitrate/sulfonate/bicarbonate transport system permease component